MSTLPWVERYRPRTVKDISHQDEVIATLSSAVATGASKGDLPHLLLYGPPGTGKTSAALALCRDLYGPGGAVYKSRLLELNASDERGIKVVRDKIKTFARLTVSAVPSGVKPPPPFKIIVLDEADAITSDAQTALRRTMEAYSKTTRFILICNYISRIIAPLASRCAKFRFQALPTEAIFTRVRFIAEKENVSVRDDVVYGLIETCGGDLRKAITTLQSAHRIAEPGESVSAEDVASAACVVPQGVVDEFDRKTVGGGGHGELRKMVEGIVRNGYSVSDLLERYSARIGNGGKEGVCGLGKLQKAAIAIAVAEAETRLVQGGDEMLQAFDVASVIAQATRNGEKKDVLREVTLT